MIGVALYSLSICSGVGGLDLSIELACPGVFTPVAFLEGEAYAAAILATRMEEKLMALAPIWSDVRTVCDARFRSYVRERTGGEGIDFAFGGIPCQPHSVAGKQIGADDPRDLWPATVRILETFKPWIFFLENVPGMLGDVSARAIPDLQRLGYVVPRPLLLEAAAVGSPQRRERLFVLAYRPQSRSRRVSKSDGRDNAADADGSRPAMADAARLRSDGRERPRSGSSGGVCESGGIDGGTVGESDGSERRTDRPTDGRRPGGERERDRTSGSDPEHAVNGRQAEQEPRQEHWLESGSDGAMGIGIGIGSQGQHEAGPAERPAIGANGSVPYWPPGPAARDEWQRILAKRPDLAPAIEREICRASDGSAIRMDATRVDELRSLGNMVVPLQGAAAFLILLARLKEALPK